MILAEPVPLRPLPWQAAPWEAMLAAIRADRLGHALLISGPAGIGKRHLADVLAAALLCATPGRDGLACGACDECRLLAAGSHPDLTRLVPDPEAKTREIKADQVRELCSSQAMTSSHGRRAVYHIAPAEAMTNAAANSLLKTLEEPAAATLWLLVSESPGGLPATVRSRCQKLALPIPPAASAREWLRGQSPAGSDPDRLLSIAHGAPLRALAMADAPELASREQCLDAFRQLSMGRADPLSIAGAWQSLEPGLVLAWIAGWVSDLLRLSADPGAGHLSNPDQREPLLGLSRRLDQAECHRYLQRVYAARAEATSTVNKQLLFESLLLRWARLTRSA
jgi:DNA polymerase-3 subunit delta'